MATEILMTREGSVAGAIQRMVQTATTSVDAALYRFNNPQLAHALQQAAQRGLRVRLVLDRNKYEESRATRELLSNGRIPFRLFYGRQGRRSKMHHKFVILDEHTALTGSYNWTLESEEENYENVLILRDPEQLQAYRREFEALWADAAQGPGS